VSGRRNDGDVTEARDPAELSHALGVPISAATLERALTHRSFAYENGGLPTNERLEFLGDSVLGLVVTDTLFTGHPSLPEGHLAKLRAAVVQMGALAEVARELRLGAYVKLGRGEEGTGGRDKPSILADTLEAVIGATYIDCGLEEASALVHRLFDPVIERSALLGAGLDWKTSLQELTAVRGLGVPEYVVKDSGPDHQKLFRAVVRVGSRELGSGEGRSKKAAEQLAAEAAWRSISAEAEAENTGPERTVASPDANAPAESGRAASGAADSGASESPPAEGTADGATTSPAGPAAAPPGPATRRKPAAGGPPVAYT
jgi:ribonuclease III